MIDINKTYRTRDGREVRIYATDGLGSHCIHGVIKTEEGWSLTSWKCDGSVSHFPFDTDLIEVKPRIKRTIWVSLYPNNVQWFTNEKAMAGEDCLARVKIEIDCEEGEGL